MIAVFLAIWAPVSVTILVFLCTPTVTVRVRCAGNPALAELVAPDFGLVSDAVLIRIGALFVGGKARGLVQVAQAVSVAVKDQERIGRFGLVPAWRFYRRNAQDPAAGQVLHRQNLWRGGLQRSEKQHVAHRHTVDVAFQVTHQQGRARPAASPGEAV